MSYCKRCPQPSDLSVPVDDISLSMGYVRLMGRSVAIRIKIRRIKLLHGRKFYNKCDWGEVIEGI